MPLRNDLLNPISPANPCGENLYNAPVYDEIKKARFEELLAPAGATEKDRKLADWPLVIKLTSESLAKKTKDLQLAVWLADAMLRREGITGFHQCLEMILGLLENFWEGLYPELEDGDAEFRASRLEQLNSERMVLTVRQLPVTQGGITWAQYGDSKKVPTEAEVASAWDKQAERQALIAEGKKSPEEFEKEFSSTPKQWYVEMSAEFDATLESLANLSRLCDEKFGDVAPTFRDLENGVDEVRRTIRSLLAEKREREPDEEPAPAAEPEPTPEPEAAGEAAPATSFADTAAAAAPARAKAPARAIAAEPESWDDAVARIVAAAKYMRQQDAYNPAPYLVLRGLRWGELRAGGPGSIDQAKLGAPPSEIRQELKKAALEADWTRVLETAETAAGMECGRGWLDLQRYVGRACESMGYGAIGAAVVSELKGLLTDYPQLPEYTMMDDTATANAETMAWLKESVIPPPPAGPEPAAQPEPEPYQYYSEPEQEAAAGGTPAPPDPFELALEAARSGRAQDGIEMLMREMMQEPTGRGRFQRKVQVAQLCVSTGNDAVALPILQDAVKEIEQRKLEEWESRDLVARTLGMLYRCLVKCDGSDSERQRLYGLICRLDPLEAMKISK